MKTLTMNNGVEIPVLGFGTFRTAQEETEKSVLTAIESGYRLIDTAEAYHNEEYVGNAIAACGVPREELFITTKVTFRAFDDARTSVENSLRYMRLDYLDLVLLHWPFGNYYAAWRTLEKMQEEGKIRAIGVSNFNPDRFIDLIHYNKVTPAINQIETNLYCQRQAEHVWEDKYGITHQSYAPLGQNRANEMFEEPIVKMIAEKYGKTPAQVCLRFMIEEKVAVIPKSTHANRIKENIDVFDFALTETEIAALRTLDKKMNVAGNPENPEKVEIAMSWK